MTPTPHAPPPNAGGRLESWLAPQPESVTFAEAVERSIAYSALTGRPVEFVADRGPGAAAAQMTEALLNRRWLEDLYTVAAAGEC